MPAGQYVSAFNQSPTDKISSAATPGVSGNQSTITERLSGALTGAGLSFSSISSSTTTALDSISSKLRGGIDELSQNVSNRLSPNQLTAKRKADAGNKETFATNHMPSRKTAAEKKSQGGVELLQYPPDMRKYYINFAIGEYVRPSAYVKTEFLPQIHIALPMPTNLLDPTGVKLNPNEMGGMIGGAAENVAALVQDIKGETRPNANAGSAGAIGNMAIGAVYNTAMDIGGAIPGLDGVMGTAGQLFGAVPNPHITVFFQGVDLRAHSFTWRFAPKNVNESILVQTIVREFKKRMLPNYKWGAANVLGYPNMVQITLEPKMEDTLYMFKKCMISSVNVNYAPNGIPSFFANSRHPTVIEFQINLQELEIFTSQDYGGKNGNFSADLEKNLSGLKDRIQTTLAPTKK
jgi:hypothetical protein